MLCFRFRHSPQLWSCKRGLIGERRRETAKVLRCRGIGMDCNLVAHGRIKEEILKKIAEYDSATLVMREILEEALAKVRAAMRDES